MRTPTLRSGQDQHFDSMTDLPTINPGGTLTRIVHVTCVDCGTGFEYEHCCAFRDERDTCDDCAAKAGAKWEQEHAREVRSANKRAAIAVIPPLMRPKDIGGESDPERFPASVWRRLCAWTPSNGRGIGLIGDSGLCKTRMLHATLARVMLDQESRLDASYADAVTMAEFKEMASNRFDGPAKERWYRIRCCRVLVLDDVDKVALTDDGMTALFNLVDFRTTREKPILWSANCADRRELVKRLSAKLNDARQVGPIVGRLAEFSPVVRVEANAQAQPPA